MGKALYRAYRPKSLSEVVGQEHITSTLVRALKQGKLAHAYLFTGPHGVGKTSIARILAHEINGLPFIDDSMHLDIIEIDAASNRRIDEIRELRDKVNVAPTSAKYKVYIIDEVHMLTREAFNALLKTLEEPPAHVVFILATTESHKLPETIVSRTQRFMFKPIAVEKVTGLLRTMADKEGIKITDDALTLIAEHGEGSFRDSISLLDQTRGLIGQTGKIDADAVRSLTGVPTSEAIDAIYTALDQADATAVSRSLSALRDQGYGAAQIAKQLGRRLRQQVLAGQALATTFDLMEKLLEVPVAHDPESYLELVVLSHALADASPMPARAPAPAKASTSTSTSIVVESPKVAAAPSPIQTTEAEPLPEPAMPPEPEATTRTNHEKVDRAVDETTWPAVVASLKKTHNTLYGIIRMATPIFYDDAIELHFTFAFHKKRLSEAKNQAIVIAVVRKLTGRDLTLRCVLDSKEAAKPVKATATVSPATSHVSAINSIFGNTEVLDS